jgi:beta-carotene hydroxylase
VQQVDGASSDTFKKLKARPLIAWPTVALLFLSLSIIASVWYFVLTDVLSIWLGCVINCWAYYFLFSPIHDGIHRAISLNPKLNDFLMKVAFLPTFALSFAEYTRVFHMQHHLHCGDEELDPDIEISHTGMNAFSRWFVWGSHYWKYFQKHKSRLPKVEVKYRMLKNITMLGTLAILLVIFPMETIFLAIIPIMFLAWMIALIFSYLPHHLHPRVEGEDEMSVYQTTCNRVGWEWLFLVLTQYQNYHLVHHLYPTVPFYRYVKVWNANKAAHEAHRPAVVNVLTNNLVTFNQ